MVLYKMLFNGKMFEQMHTKTRLGEPVEEKVCKDQEDEAGNVKDQAVTRIATLTLLMVDGEYEKLY